jgi:hypothetical protein
MGVCVEELGRSFYGLGMAGVMVRMIGDEGKNIRVRRLNRWALTL